MSTNSAWLGLIILWVAHLRQPTDWLYNGIQVLREIVGALTDITERKQAEEALREYNIRLAMELAERIGELQDAQEKLVRQEKLAVLGQLGGPRVAQPAGGYQ